MLEQMKRNGDGPFGIFDKLKNKLNTGIKTKIEEIKGEKKEL